MADHTGHYRFREELVKRLKADLLGPTGKDAGSEETIHDWPVTTYAIGVLFPQVTDPERAATEAAENDYDDADSTLAIDETPDTGVTLANVQKPSAAGLTFAVDASFSRTIEISAAAAVYEPVSREGLPVQAERAERRSTDAQNLHWQRRPLDLSPITVDVTVPHHDPMPLAAGLSLRLRVRPPQGPRGIVSVTATLVNTHTVGTGDLQDTYCFFQVGLRIQAPGGVKALVERPAPGSNDDEVLLNRLLHRHAPSFATGHGCAADWQWAPHSPRGWRKSQGHPAAVSAVWTEFVPTYEVLLTDSNPEVDVAALGMKHLADARDSEVISALRGLVTGYGEWIADREADAAALLGTHYGDTEYTRITAEQLKLCGIARERMTAGIDLLMRNPNAMEAFKLANRAMATQRARTSWIKDGKKSEPVENGVWYPFQIGFLLLCLNGIADPDHRDRQVADLLWFPTGGGKTEAYLGLIAFTVFLRRLRLGQAGGGVTVLMRYTLRLLTLQQFERAATLMCAMDSIRREDISRFGSEQISIGMWVGKAATPNFLNKKSDKQSADKLLRKLRNNDPVQEGNPVQLRSCSWCGTPLDHLAYRVDAALKRMVIECRSPDCEFREGLPVHLVDEAIYHHRPTLVIATADKFAQVAWREEVAALFNRDIIHRGTPAPELVVQDELHLISGPLGTLAGLYEAAIDVASNTPKVIASTATIRRAQDQGKALFNRREVVQFPPAGLDSRDSWFAVETPARDKASRHYLGLLAPGVSQATLLVRAYASLLHHVEHIEGSESVKDAYWTLVGYFNSLRLLAAADLQVRDDVHDRLQLLAGRAGVTPREAEMLAELTSRIPSSRIPEKLKELETRLPGPALDVVLATNMISVGVDVDRLGLMAVLGQPQTTAEYIQATSRVGRRHPGLVVTLFNAARSRDRSHYEGFVPYHSALYRQVESTSVTPFSSRARDRALHAVFVGLARLLIPTARPNAAAGRVEGFVEQLRDLRTLLVARAASVSDSKEEVDATAEELDWIIEDWCKLAADNPELLYEAPFRHRPGEHRNHDTALLRGHQDEDLTEARDTMWSFRDVDVESDLYLEH
ncbi:helicase-related protein [Streptomyces sp. NPDC004647]|uniref:helicase-related protein n=1 Tax=Streptomyces sp. NPDC004647 TaxID=3154671 RepID=UPI0033B51217